MEQLKKDSLRVLNKNPKDFGDAITFWINSAENLNRDIRSGDITETHNVNSSISLQNQRLKYSKHLLNLDRMVSQVKTTEEILLHRRIWDEDLYSSLQVGDIIENLTYMSTTFDTAGEEFGDVKLIIHVPAGINAFYISVIDKDSRNTEKEVILMPGSMRYDKCTKKKVYHFTVISSHPFYTNVILSEMEEGKLQLGGARRTRRRNSRYKNKTTKHKNTTPT